MRTALTVTEFAVRFALCCSQTCVILRPSFGRRTLCSVLFLIFVLGKASVTSEQTPQKSPDRNAFTFLNWDLKVRIETKTESLFVRGRITLRNDSAQPQRQIPLQISSSLSWASIKQNGTPAPFTPTKLRSDLDHTGTVEEAVVILPEAAPPGAPLDLEVGYSGTVPLDSTRLAELDVPLEQRTATDYDRISPTFTCLRGVGHVLWFPVSLEPALLSDGNRVFEESSAWAVRHTLSRMKLEVSSDLPEPGRVRTNAQESSFSSDGEPGSHGVEHEWRHLGLAGPVLIAGNYAGVIARAYRFTTLTVNFFPEHRTQAEDYARVIRETTPMVSGKSEFSTSFVDLPETQDAAFDGDSVFLTPLKTIDRKSLELIAAYMFAHQTLWSPRAWIYEGAAHLAQVLMRERQDGRAAAIAYMQERLPGLTIADLGASATAKSNSLINTTSEMFYRTKAMYVWWMLRELVGQRALLDSLQEYDSAADKESSYVQKLLENNSHKDLEWFFDDWVYQDRGLAEFTISNGYARPSLQGVFLVSATIENSGGAGAEVPVIVHTQQGDVVSRLRVPGHSKAAARIEVGSKPIDITVNDGSVPEVDQSDNTTAVRIGNE